MCRRARVLTQLVIFQRDWLILQVKVSGLTFSIPLMLLYTISPWPSLLSCTQKFSLTLEIANL